jgi:hypothetical protein
MQSAEGVDGALVARIVGEELDVSNK